MKKAVILLSGGLDSTTLAAIAKKDYQLHALSFSYGQRHDIELQFAKKIIANLDIKQHKIAEIDLGIFGHSALTDEKIAVPKYSYGTSEKPQFSKKCEAKKENGAQCRQNYMSTGSLSSTKQFEENGGFSGVPYDENEIPITYVPARNTIFLSFALAYAESINAFDIFIGVNAVDYSGYPDCRGEFIKAFEKMANLATSDAVNNKGKYQIHTPLINLTKAQIIKIGLDLGVDYSKAHSCYDPIEKGGKIYACGKCDSCILRLKGFEENNIKDPYLYI